MNLWLPSIFSDYMVVQQDEPIVIWGKAEKNTSVRIYLNDRETDIATDEDGCWKTDLAPLPVGKSYTMTIQAGDEQKVIKDILSGEVWYASGQSNMELTLSRLARRDDIKEVLKDAEFPSLRLFKTERRGATDMLENDVGGSWALSTVETAGNFSAVAYIFGAMLARRLNVPVGIIVSAVGATSIQAWMKRELPATLYTRSNGALERRGNFYYGMVAGLQPYRIKGMLWYQGENNAVWFDAREYGILMQAFIDDTRREFQNPQLPFLFVQLPAFEARGGNWGWRDFVSLRYEQAKIAKIVPHTGMAVTIDLGEEKNIHPGDKYPVAERLYRLAMHQVYQMEEFAGFPSFSRLEKKEDCVHVLFDHCGMGLVTLNDTEIFDFEVSGLDGIFRPVTATIIGPDTVRIPVVEKICAVRYAWKNWIRPVLFNKEGYPAAPFWHQVME